MKRYLDFDLLVLVSGIFLISSMSAEVFSYPMQVEGANNEAQRTEEFDGKNFQDQLPSSPLDELRMRLFLLSWLESLSRDQNLNQKLRAKKTCFVNAGLSHSCDYKNALAAKNEERFFISDQSPGRK